MKSLKLALLALPLVLAFLVSSCEETPAESTNPPHSTKLETPEARLDVQATGETVIKVTWNAIAGAEGYNCVFDESEPQFTKATEMVYENLKPGELHFFRIQSVAPKDSGVEDSRWSENLSVRTTGEPEEEPQPQDAGFQITVDPSTITFYDAYMNVVAEDKNAWYYPSYVPKSVLEQMESDEAYVNEVIASIEALGQISEKTFEEMFLALRQKGDNKYKLNNLDPDTEYYAYAFGFNEKKEITVPMVKSLFRTAQDPGFTPSEMTLDVSVSEVTGTTAKISVTPSKDDEWYFFAASHADNISDKSDGEILASYISLFNEYLIDMSFEEFAAENLSKGPDSYKYSNLQEGQSYKVLAFGVSIHGAKAVASTPLTKFDFVTTESVETEDAIEITIGNVTSTTIEATFTPKAGVRYLCEVKLASEVAGKSDDQIISDYMEYYDWEIIPWMVQTGVHTEKNYREYPADTEYIVYAFGVDADDKPNTPLYKKFVKTLAN